MIYFACSALYLMKDAGLFVCDKRDHLSRGLEKTRSRYAGKERVCSGTGKRRKDAVRPAKRAAGRGGKEIFMTTKTAAGKEVKAYSDSRVRYIAVTGILSAVAFVLQLIEIPVPMFMPTFIKFDFSDLPALIGAFAMGPACGIMIELIKNILHAILATGSFAVGELSNFILGSVFVGVAGLIYKYNKTKKGALIASLAGAVAMAAVSFPSNYFVVYPVYYQFMPEETILAAYQAIIPSMTSVAQSLLVFNVPFTLVKGLLDAALTFVVYKKISPILHG